jgi:DNA polymerase III delta prime subunit
MSDFTEAVLDGNAYVRMALCGPSGCGKTLTALLLAAVLGKRVCVLETERDTAKLYTKHSGVPKPYFVKQLTKFSPDNYIKWVNNAADEGFDVCIIDSLTPSWNGAQGVLDIAGSDIRGWKTATPKYYELVNCVTGMNNRMHIIATFRSKQEHTIALDEATGKMRVTKKGLLPIHRDEMIYEWDIVGDMDMDHTISFNGIGKTRASVLDGKTFDKPGSELGLMIKGWLKGE